MTEHGPISGLGNYDGDRWQLFHTDEDRAEAHDLAEQHPEKVEELKKLFWEEAERYDVFPLLGGLTGFYGMKPPRWSASATITPSAPPSGTTMSALIV